MSEIKYNESTRNRPLGERPVDAPMVTIDIPAYLQQIKQEEAWEKYDRNAITVFKTDNFSHVLVALHGGAVLDKAAAEGLMSIHVLEGSISCKAMDQRSDLKAGQIITIHKGIAYTITSNEDSCFLLTMTNAED